jgi:hypothetical protein
MYRIDNSTAATSLPTPGVVGPNPNGFFTSGSPGVVPATIVDADWMNAVQETLANPIEATGATLSKTDKTQLTVAIPKLIQHSLTQYTSSTSLTVPAGVYWVWGEACSGGSGGGGSTGSGGVGSGGGGSPKVKFGFAVTPADTLALTVGAGGTANGGVGGTTVVSLNGSPMVTITAGGGGVGGNTALATTAGAAGTYSVASGVDFSVRPGLSGQLPFTTGTSVYAGGVGGAAGGGGYGAIFISGANLAGAVGNGYGGGGGGGIAGGNGGVGGAGFVDLGWG